MADIEHRIFRNLDDKTFVPLYESLTSANSPVLCKLCMAWSPYRMRHIYRDDRGGTEKGDQAAAVYVKPNLPQDTLKTIKTTGGTGEI